MNTILSQLFRIFEEETDILSKEAQLYAFMAQLFSELLVAMFERLDKQTIQPYLEV